MDCECQDPVHGGRPCPEPVPPDATAHLCNPCLFNCDDHAGTGEAYG